MIEAFAKAASEVGKESSKETGGSLKNFDTRKRVDGNDSRVDNMKTPDSSKTTIDIDKRKPIEKSDNKIGLNDKVENSFSETLKQYFNELKQFSEHPEALPDKLFDKIENVSPEKVKQLRFEFRRDKNSLIQQWEKITGKEWPRYDKDVYIKNKNGEMIKIRNKGDYYDAHHIKPLSLGGKNTADNITPMRAENHYDSRGIHRLDGPCSKMQEIAKGKN